jgi:hypothetical protein
MNADRETFAPTANRSIPFSTSEDKLSDIFTFAIAIVLGYIGGFNRFNSPSTR